MSEEVKSEHALFSPSGAQKWMDGGCPGSLAMESTCPNESSVYAAEGTAAHKLAEWTLQDISHNTRAYLGRVIKVEEENKTYDITVSEEMCDYIQDFVDEILRRVEEYKEFEDVIDVTLHLEERVAFSSLVGKEKQFGTVDILMVIEYADGTARISVEDLKYGQGVPVVAKGNKQLKIYGRAALEEFSLLYDVVEVNTAIHMIRKEYISEHLYTAEELYKFDAELKYSADKCRAAIDLFELEACSEGFQKTYLNPGDHCKKGFCAARGKCPAYAKFSLETMTDKMENLNEIDGEVEERVQDSIDEIDEGMVSLEQLNEYMNAADVIEDWIKAVRGRIAAELHAGEDVPDYMLAEGKKGNRAWVDSTEAEETMKSMRLKQDEMYKRSLITPTQAMKLDSVKNSKRKTNRLDKLITQADGKPTVARKDSGKKPLEVKPVVDSFEDLTDDIDDLA